MKETVCECIIESFLISFEGRQINCQYFSAEKNVICISMEFANTINLWLALGKRMSGSLTVPRRPFQGGASVVVYCNCQCLSALCLSLPLCLLAHLSRRLTR